MAPINSRNNNNNGHLNSPYARTPRRSYGGRSQPQPSNTPSSLFKRVKQIFTPSIWLNKSNISNSTNGSESAKDLDSVVAEAEKSIILHQDSRNSIEDSPNVKLANFFAHKGSQPLTDIEIEGVKSLLTQSQFHPSTPTANRTFSRFPSNEPEVPSTPTVLKNETAKTILQQTPKFKASYHTTSDSPVGEESFVAVNTSTSTSITPFKRKTFDYSAFPSPYRSSRLKNSVLYLEDEEKSKKKAKIEEQKIPEKKLSNTASALLSYLDNNDSRSETSTKESNKAVDYSNPYASRTKKVRKPLAIHAKKPTKFEQLEKSFASESEQEKSEDPATTPNKQNNNMSLDAFSPCNSELQSVNKHKPVRSSALRESITMEDGIEVTKKDNDNDNETTPSSKPFQFGKPSDDTTPSKPSLFSFGANKEETNSTTTSSFSFGKPVVSTATESNPEPKPFTSFGSTTSASANTKHIIIPETTGTKSFSFGSTSVVPSKPTIPEVSKSAATFNPPKSSSFNFVFPNAEAKYLFTEVDESKLDQLKNLYAF